jgi:surfeit locus 1 family protein
MLALHLAAVLAVVATLLLGRWQYGAWQHGREDQAAARVDVPAKPLGSVITSDEPFPGDAVGQPVRVAGRWLPRSTIYVSDRTLGSRRGVWAVTPVAVCGGATACAKAPAVLVVRGWAPRVADVPAAPSGAVRLTGWLQPGEGSGVTDPNPRDDVVPELGIADALQHVDQDLYGGYVIARHLSDGRGDLAAVTPASLPKAPATTSLRNLLYALEWWVFGGFAVYVWWRWCRDEVSRVTGVPSSA